MGPNILNVDYILVHESNSIINFRFLRIPSLISKDQKENIISTVDDVRRDFMGPPHGTSPAAVIENKNTTEFKSSEHINEKGDGPYHGFGYLSPFSDPIDLAT